MEINLLPELYRRVHPRLWHQAPPLGSVTPQEIEAARFVLAEADPWTRFAYARWYPRYFADLAPDPPPPVLRD